MTQLAADQQWDPDDWEKHVHALLGIHHHLCGETYHRVPRVVNGDGGLDGYSSSGHAYQAYAEQVSSVKERRTKQLQKINDDLPKLEKNKTFWAQTLQSVKIVQWNLVVPILQDKDVLRHAQVKAAELKRCGLSFIGPTFCARITTDEDYPLALNVLRREGVAAVKIPVPLITNTDIDDVEQQKAGLIPKMDAKVKRLMPSADDADRTETRRELLNHYLRNENMMKKLFIMAKPIWETVQGQVDAMEERLALYSRFAPGSPDQRLIQTADELRQQLTRTAGSLGAVQIEYIVLGTIASWLLRCPLNFPQYTSSPNVRPTNTV